MMLVELVNRIPDLFEGSKPRTIVTLVAGATLLVIGGVHEAFTKRAAILPPRLFKVNFFSELETWC